MKKIISLIVAIGCVFCFSGCGDFFTPLPEGIFDSEVEVETPTESEEEVEIPETSDDTVVEEEVPVVPEYEESEPLVFSSGVHTIENLKIVATAENRAAIYAEGAGTVVVINSGYYDGGDEGSVPAVYARDGAKIVINGGEFYAGEGNATVYAKNYAYIEINGGDFSADGAWEGNYYVLNLADNTSSAICVKGGIYKDFNPAENASENPSVNFVAEGYEVVFDGVDKYTVQEIEHTPTI